MCPHVFRDLEAILCVILMHDQDGAVLCTPVLFWNMWLTLRLIKFHHGLSCVGKCQFYVVIFTRLWLCRLCCDWIGKSDCAVTCSHENGADRHLIGLLHMQSHPPMKLTLGIPNLSPAPNICPQSNQLIHPPPSCKQKKEMAPESRKHLRGENFKGGLGHFQVTHTSLGSRVSCLACRGKRLLHRVILGPRRIF